MAEERKRRKRRYENRTWTREMRAKILEEYDNAVAANKGGGAEVLRLYDLTTAHIAYWRRLASNHKRLKSK